MEHTIHNMNHKLNLYEGEKLIASLNGYAFYDKWGHCIIIVYGESKRDALSEYLNEKTRSHSSRDRMEVS